MRNIGEVVFMCFIDLLAMREEDMADDLVISSLGNRQSDDGIKPSGSGTEFIVEVGEKLALFIYFGHEAGGILAPFHPLHWKM